MRDPVDDTSIGRLKRRADFVRAAKGKRWHGKALSLQALARRDADTAGGSVAVRVGFTLTRKVGGAVIRNRARRRLKEAVRLAPDLPVRAGHDYVIVGRIDAIRLSFASLKSELVRAIGAVHDKVAAARPSDHTRPKRTRLKP